MKLIEILHSLLFIFCLTTLANAQCVSGDCQNGKGIYEYPSGAKYIGEFKAGEIHGIGTCHYTDGSKYQGNWVYRYPEGKGTKTYPDGSKWTGLWKKGKPINQQGEFIEDALISQNEEQNDGTDIQAGCLKGNCTTGDGIFAYADGSKYEGQFLNGKLDGRGTWHYPNGDYYIGAFKNNHAHGKGTVYHPDGSKTTGDWAKGEFVGSSTIESGRYGCVDGNCEDGYGTYVYNDGEAKYIGNFQNGQPHGEGACYYANGERYRGEWASGSFNGNGTLFLNDGKQIAGNWKDGSFQRKNTDAPIAYTPSQTNDDYSSTNDPVRTKNDHGLRVWAVVVGVASYNHMPVLRYTDDDAYRMYAFLKSPEGGALPDEQIRILIDEDATKEKIQSTMQEVFTQAGSNDLVMLYFSGHGLKGSFLPIDFDGFNNKLMHEEINTIFKNSPAKYKLCIADACHSGSLLAARSSGVQNTLQTYYKKLAQAQAGTALIMSSKSEETSLESSGLRQGVFSHFLIRGLKGEGDTNQDDLVSVQELYNYIEGNVRSYTGMRQSPVITGDYDRNMPVAVKRQ